MQVRPDSTLCMCRAQMLHPGREGCTICWQPWPRRQLWDSQALMKKVVMRPRLRPAASSLRQA